MSQTILTISVVLIAVGIWVGVTFLVSTLVQVRRTAQSLEILTYKLQESLDQLRETGSLLHEFSSRVRSGWMRALEVAIGTAAALWPHHRSEPENDNKPSPRKTSHAHRHETNPS